MPAVIPPEYSGGIVFTGGPSDPLLIDVVTALKCSADPMGYDTGFKINIAASGGGWPTGLTPLSYSASLTVFNIQSMKAYVKEHLDLTNPPISAVLTINVSLETFNKPVVNSFYSGGLEDPDIEAFYTQVEALTHTCEFKCAVFSPLADWDWNVIETSDLNTVKEWARSNFNLAFNRNKVIRLEIVVLDNTGFDPLPGLIIPAITKNNGGPAGGD